MRLTARDKDFILRCALAAHFTSPATPAKRPLVCKTEERRLAAAARKSHPVQRKDP